MKEKQQGFFNWIKTHPTKFFIIIFLIIIPIFILSILVGSFFKNGNKFYFDKQNEQPIYLYQKDISKSKKVDKYLDFNIELKTLTHFQDEKEDKKEFVYDEYTFKFTHSPKDLYRNASFNFRGVLGTKWLTEQSSVNTIYTNSSSLTKFKFETELPQSKYLIFNVKKPILYIHIEIIVPSGTPGLPTLEEKIDLYIKYDLNKIDSNSYDIKLVTI